MLTISLTLVVIVSAVVLLHQYVTGALLPGEERPNTGAEPIDDAGHAAPRAA